jgi:hypothetical protein
VRRFLDKKRTVALWDLRWREKCAAQGALLANVRNIGYATGSMDAAPLLQRIAATLRDCKLEAVLIGNAAAALHGAPVTTLDFDFLFRATPANIHKRKGNQTRSRRAELAAVKRESEAGLREQIRSLLRKPMAERTHFLRKRLPGGGSTL